MPLNHLNLYCCKGLLSSRSCWPSMLRLHLRPIHHPVCACDICRHSNLAGKMFSHYESLLMLYVAQ